MNTTVFREYVTNDVSAQSTLRANIWRFYVSDFLSSFLQPDFWGVKVIGLRFGVYRKKSCKRTFGLYKNGASTVCG